MIVDLAVHSFSAWHHFRNVPGFDAIAYIDLMESLGFTGINLSLNDPNYRHLGGREDWRMDGVRQRLTRSNLSLEIDTSDTAPANMSRMLKVAERMGAQSLRTYTRHAGTPAEMMRRTEADLRQVVNEAQGRGVVIVLENHEDFTGPELAAIVGAVDHPNLRILYDYGNSQMVLEDPEEALDVVLPYVHSVHAKDHVMVRERDAGRLTVAGVPMGEGFLPLERLTRRLLDRGLRRICFENVWHYSTPIRPGRVPVGATRLGEGSFRYADPPFNPGFLILDVSQHSGAELVRLEREALDRGLVNFRRMLKTLGVTGYRASAA